MIRALFLGVGVVLILFGAISLGVKEAELRTNRTEARLGWGTAGTAREWELPEHLPYGLMSTGAVIVLYCMTFASGKKKASGGH